MELAVNRSCGVAVPPWEGRAGAVGWYHMNSQDREAPSRNGSTGWGWFPVSGEVSREMRQWYVSSGHLRQSHRSGSMAR